GPSSLNLAFRLAARQALWQCPPRSRLKAFPRVVLVGARAFSLVASANSGCRSSVVEHSLGKGEVESSIPSGSTIFASENGRFALALSLLPSDRRLNIARKFPTGPGKSRGLSSVCVRLPFEGGRA